MKKTLIYSLFLTSLFLCGCNNQGNTNGYIYNVETDAKLSIDNDRHTIDKQKIYFTNEKWKIEHKTNEKLPFSKPTDLFDGDYLYTIVKNRKQNIALKDNYLNLTKQELYMSTPAYALLNWNTYNPKNIYMNFDKNSELKEIGSAKSKYGYNCTQYEHNWKNCKNNFCYDITRKICIDKTNDKAVSINIKQVANNDSKLEATFNLELINHKKVKLDDDIFNISSIKNIKIVEEGVLNK